jgi:hypothetical protein
MGGLAWALSMDGMSNEFFTGAALTAYQHRDIRKGNSLNKTEDVLHALRTSDDPMKLILGGRIALV